MEEKLREAACFGDSDGLTALLNKGVDINAQHKINGWTALHWAVKRNNVQCVDILLSRGADKAVFNSQGETAAMLTTNKQVLKSLGFQDVAKKAMEDGSAAPAPNERSTLPRPKTPKTPKVESSNCSTSFVPNYLRHPVVGYKVQLDDEDYQHANGASTPNAPNEHSERGRAPGTPISGPGSRTDTLLRKSKSDSRERAERESRERAISAQRQTPQIRILKVRLTGKLSCDRDFIEIDILSSELSFRKLIDVTCDEFSINPKTIIKIRKLPNTKLRRDVEIQRLKDYEEIEFEVADI